MKESFFIAILVVLFCWWSLAGYKHFNFFNQLGAVSYSNNVTNIANHPIVQAAKDTINKIYASSASGQDDNVDNSVNASSTIYPAVSHIKTPKNVKAIYMSSYVAGTPSIRNKLVNMIDTTELNAVVIDVKDNSGIMSWDGRVPDLNNFVKELHDKNIYVIARVASFQDPEFVKKHPELAVRSKKTGDVWRDHKGVPWIDTGSMLMWQRLVSIGEESYARGFDEINYDYIRFPTDGLLSDMVFPISGIRGLHDKRNIVKDFYKYLHDNLSVKGIPISGDVFGIITVVPTEANTLGQDLHDALTYFDFVAPMVYPSHFYTGTDGYKNPADHPKEIIDFSMRGAIKIVDEMVASSSEKVASSTDLSSVASSTLLVAKLRPWYQDFDMGAIYTAPMVRAQIEAGYGDGVNSWMLWDPKNKYTPDALETRISGQ